MSSSFYESDAAVEQYLLFHYGTPAQICPLLPDARPACGFPARCVSESMNRIQLDERTGSLWRQQGRALDLGCATGRSSFELGRQFGHVTGIDFSGRFIAAAKHMQQQHEAVVRTHLEGPAYDEVRLTLPADLRTDHVNFEQGDACVLRADIGRFELVLMANLIDRLPDPLACLHRLPQLVAPDGWVIITSPYTWLEEYTPRDKWLDGDGQGTLSALKEILAPAFHSRHVYDLPFLIREHRRKYQWSVAEVSLWQRK